MQLKKQQEALDQGLRMTEDRLTKMEQQLTQLHRLDDLESKMVASMEFHVDTNATLRSLTRQMDTMMKMMSQMTQATQDDELLKQVRDFITSERGRKSKFNQGVGENLRLSPEMIL